MKPSPILTAIFAALLLSACARVPQSAAPTEPRTFLKIGSMYRLTIAPAQDGTALAGNLVKIHENGGGGWFRAECFMLIMRDGKEMLLRQSESWINFGHVIRATEEPAREIV